jgi:hypothetical protein
MTPEFKMFLYSIAMAIGFVYLVYLWFNPDPPMSAGSAIIAVYAMWSIFDKEEK